VTANQIIVPAFLALISPALAAKQTQGPPPAPSSAPAQTAAPAQTSAATSAEPNRTEHILQDGTPVKLALLREISSAHAELGQKIEFEVLNDLAVDGFTVLRRGTLVTGVVTEVEKKKRLGRAGVLNFSIPEVTLADGSKVPVRAFNNTSGDSHTVGVAALALNMPLAAAPFFLLMHGENSTIPKGTEITVFISGDIRLSLSDFNLPPPSATAKQEEQSPTPAAAPK